VIHAATWLGRRLSSRLVCGRSGRLGLIEAVRVYRKQTGVSLLEAKQAVDRIAAGRGLTGH
jgi:hypothetical protein